MSRPGRNPREAYFFNSTTEFTQNFFGSIQKNLSWVEFFELSPSFGGGLIKIGLVGERFEEHMRTSFHWLIDGRGISCKGNLLEALGSFYLAVKAKEDSQADDDGDDASGSYQ